MRVSVVIPCFNAEQYIEETIASVLAQTMVPDEIIVVDDGSTDRSAAIAAGIDTRVHVIRQVNAGESVARNRGIEEATGDWVAFLDADDLWQPDKIAAQLAACEKNADIACCHTAVAYQFDDSLVSPEIIEPLRAGDYSMTNMLLHWMVHPSSALVRRSLPVRFPEWTRSGEDLLYFTELSLVGRFAFVPRELVRYRKHAGSQSADATAIVRNRESCLRWLAMNGERLDPDAKAHAEEALVGDLLDRLKMLKWKRDWQQYWAMREFLTSYYAGKPTPTQLREWIWFPWTYRARDVLGSLLAPRRD